MNLEKYAEGAKVTESLLLITATSNSNTPTRIINSRLLHAAMGLCTESGEIMDVLKRHVFYGKELDQKTLINLLEEAGDISWYLFGLLLDELGKLLQKPDIANKCLAGNLAKLRERYGEKFSEYSAMHRDVIAEIEALKAQSDVQA